MPSPCFLRTSRKNRNNNLLFCINVGTPEGVPTFMHKILIHIFVYGENIRYVLFIDFMVAVRGIVVKNSPNLYSLRVYLYAQDG